MPKGRHFIIYIDHNPLITTMNNNFDKYTSIVPQNLVDMLYNDKDNTVAVFSIFTNVGAL